MEHIDVHKLKSWIEEGKQITLLDIREPHEVDFCKLPNCTHIPMNKIPYHLDDLEPQETIVVYCHTGVRSMYVCQYLLDQGYQKVLNLLGGIHDWSLHVDPSVPIY